MPKEQIKDFTRVIISLNEARAHGKVCPGAREGAVKFVCVSQ